MPNKCSHKLALLSGKDNPRSAAFTMVELVVVVLILSLIAGYISISLYRQLDSTLLRESTRQLWLAARYARMLAGHHQQRYLLHIDMAENAYWLSSQPLGVPVDFEDAPQSSSDDKSKDDVAISPAADSFMQKRYLDEKVHFVSVQVSHVSRKNTDHILIAFEPDGTARGALIQLANENEIYTLVVTGWSGKAEIKPYAVTDMPTETIME